MWRWAMAWLLLGVVWPVAAQHAHIVATSDGIQVYRAMLTDERDSLIIALPDVRAGDTLSAHASGEGIDPFLRVMDDGPGRTFAEDDDGGGYPDAALRFRAPRAGDYRLVVQSLAGSGMVQVRVGINTPDLFDGLAILNAGACTAGIRWERPRLSGDTRTYDGDTWVIHYTLTGRDATTAPYVTVVADAVARSLAIQYDQLGWAAPPTDCGRGGDDRLDIYIMDLAAWDAVGLAAAEQIVGDNPHTAAQEWFAAASYLMIDNDMRDPQTRLPRDNQRLLDEVRLTVAHEIHHNIQFGYDVDDPFFGLYEAGATWLETLVYPHSHSAAYQAAAVLENPDVCVGAYQDAHRRRAYGEWLLLDSLTRDLGRDAYQRIWQGMIARDGLAGFYAALAHLGTSPSMVVERMAIRNLLRDYAALSGLAQPLKIEGVIEGAGILTPRDNGVQELAVDYLRVAALDRYRLELTGDAALVMRVIAIDTRTHTAQVYALDRQGTVDLRGSTHAYLMILNTTRHDDPQQCAYADWTLRVAADTTSPALMPVEEIWSAENFIEAN